MPNEIPLNLKKEIDRAIADAFSNSIITIRVGHFSWWNVRIRLATFLIRMGAAVLGAKSEVEDETPSTRGGGLS